MKHIKQHRLFITVLATLMTLIGFVLAADASLTITVASDARWGAARPENIKRLCENVALHFQEQLRDENKVNGGITVIYNESNPKIWSLGNSNFRIGLHVTDRYWDNFSYQFGHEFGHVLQHKDAFDEGNPSPQNYWFFESICELANLWVIRRMGETWEHRPPYDNWTDYRHHLTDYANNWMMSRAEVQYMGTGAEWLQEWENKIRNNVSGAFTYARVSQLSYKFLSIFEENPKAWNAVRQMPATNSKMSQYMHEWYDNVDIADKQVVASIADVMGIDVGMSVIPSENTLDAYTYLTFTDTTDTSMKPINPADEWDGWIRGVWEKKPDGTVGKKPVDYLEFDEMGTLTHWIYSHAPSEIRYDISEKNHIAFCAYFLLPNPSCGGGASMELTAFADDTEIHTQELLLSDYGTHIEFDIPPNTKHFRISIDEIGSKNCDHFVLGEPRLYYNDAVSIESETVTESDIDADVNNDGYVDLYDVLIVRSGMNAETSYDTDLNNDGKTDEVDLLIVKAKAIEAIAAASPSARKVKITTWGKIKQK